MFYIAPSLMLPHLKLKLPQASLSLRTQARAHKFRLAFASRTEAAASECRYDEMEGT